MLFKVLVEYSDRIGSTSLRNKKIGIINEFLSKLKGNEVEIGVNYIAGKIRQGKINLAWQGLSQLVGTQIRVKKRISLITVDRYLEQTKLAKGRQKIKVLHPLFAVLSRVEQKYLVSLILSDVHQGAGEGLVKTAIARFFGLSDGDIERAYMHKPDIAQLFAYSLNTGKKGILNIGIKIFDPVKPMLAEISENLEDIFKEYDDFALEYKLDGIRIQVHKKDRKIKIFSRHLKDISYHFPELVDVARAIPLNEFILDGEAIGIDDKGRPLPFQILAKRITRKKDIDKMKKKIPVLPKFFDVLYIPDNELASKNYAERWQILNDIVRNKNHLAARKLPVSKGDGVKFLKRSLTDGNEGVVVKLLDSPYRAGKRGKFWFKIKSVHTVDCVILAAEWGHGRRKGWLSNFHLGVLDETNKKFLMVGKTFKGLTDKMLVWLTNDLQKIKVHEDSWTLYVKPEVVVEIAFNGVQKSPKYDSGYALRFARVRKIRHDKDVTEINTIIDLEKLQK